jgi:hypothetical protein
MRVSNLNDLPPVGFFAAMKGDKEGWSFLSSASYR